MFSFEQLMTADTVAVGDWRCLEPMPPTTPHLGLYSSGAEPTWVDDCFSFFVDNFSSDAVDGQPC